MFYGLARRQWAPVSPVNVSNFIIVNLTKHYPNKDMFSDFSTNLRVKHQEFAYFQIKARGMFLWKSFIYPFTKNCIQWGWEYSNPLKASSPIGQSPINITLYTCTCMYKYVASIFNPSRDKSATHRWQLFTLHRINQRSWVQIKVLWLDVYYYSVYYERLIPSTRLSPRPWKWRETIAAGGLQHSAVRAIM